MAESGSEHWAAINSKSEGGTPKGTVLKVKTAASQRRGVVSYNPKAESY